MPTPRANPALALVAGALLLGACRGDGGDREFGHLSGEGLGTTWTVRWSGGADAEAVSAAVVEALHEVDVRMSTWKPDSELSRIRAADGPVEVSAETALVVEAALDLAEMTAGAFDPTVQPLVELWGFHLDRRETLPSEEEIAAARAQVGHERVEVSWQPGGGASVSAGGTALDLSAIAKGHAVDRVSLALSGMGLPNHMVEVGGEVRVAGVGTTGGEWRIGVDEPDAARAPGTKLAAVLGLTNLAMATSGNYRSFVEIEGKRFGHTMDPRTGRPAENGVLSATVVAPDCRTADGLATALMVLAPEEGMALIEAWPAVDALLVLDGDRTVESGGMQRFLR